MSEESLNPERDELWAKHDGLTPACCAEMIALAGKLEQERNLWKHEAELLRGELAKADAALKDNISTFIDLREQVEDLRKNLKTAIQWIDDGTDQEGRDLIVEPFRAKYFPPKADPSLDSENTHISNPCQGSE